MKIKNLKYYNQNTIANSNVIQIKCRETCCERWKIIVDKSAFEKYTQSENEVIKEIVKTGLSINEASINESDYATINLNNEMMCPFLNQNNLCEVFINMGESSLSKTCKSYPRAIIMIKDDIERGLEMSCSVAAELALLNDRGIEFEYDSEPINFHDMYVVSTSHEDLKHTKIVREIRLAVIELLQSRHIELSERVAIVGYFLDQVTQNIDFSTINVKDAVFRIKKEKRLIGLQDFRDKIEKNQLRRKQQFHHLNTILSMKFKEGDSISFFSKRYTECLMEVLDAFGSVKEKELEKYYKISYENNLKPYLEKKAYILENFLVNYFFIYSSELFELKNIWTSYLKLCVIYGLIKFNLVGLAAYNNGMNDDLMLKLIQSLSKTIISDKKYLKAVIKYLEEENLDDYTKLIGLVLD